MAARLKEAGPFVDEIDRMIYPTLNHSYHHVYFMLDNIIGKNEPSPTITNTYVDKMATFPKLSPYLSSQRHTVGCAQGPMQNHKNIQTISPFLVYYSPGFLGTARWICPHRQYRQKICTDGHESKSWNPDERRKT